MFLSTRLSGKPLADLCHRLAVQLESGIDIRKIWQRELERAPRACHEQISQIATAVNTGETLTDAVRRTGEFFPPLFLQMVHVGENTGMLSEVFHRLAAHYQRQHEMARTLRARVAWPLTQLAMALLVIGILIYVMGIIAGQNRGEVVDILGFGLYGTRGLLIYLNFLLCCGLIVAGLVVAFRRRLVWTKALQHGAIQLPYIGPSLEKLCLAQLTWAMHLTLNVELDLRRLIPLVLRATGNDYYACQSDAIVADIVDGDSLSVAFRNTGIFPTRLIDALEVGEESGQLVESLARLSRQYEAEADEALRQLATLAGFAVWCGVAVLIITMIFRIFGFYLRAIQGI